MFELPGEVELLGVCYYKSNKENVIPNIVPENVFYIEIIVDGEVYSGEWGEQRICKRGDILWHQTGEETIWQRTAPDKEFQSFAIRFRKLTEWQRPAHFGRWYNMDNLNEFIIDTMRHAFNLEIDRRILGNYLIHRLLWEFYISTVSIKKELPSAFAKVIALMQNIDMASISISKLAKTVDLSEAHLNNLFRKYLNTTPHKYLLSQRLKHARVLLSSTDCSIKEICSMCGFTSVESFYRVFRNESGITPAAFRRRYIALLQTDLVRNKSSIDMGTKISEQQR
ncbi:MAG: helix-turn-helix transcriptional regulator [Lentisphaeria bacterium]|nr:helix-turn-helix transcriptional regulator [Lentisphaeria bacterium]